MNRPRFHRPAPEGTSAYAPRCVRIHIAQWPIAVVSIILAATLAGCGGDTTDEPAAENDPRVDACATTIAESMLDPIAPGQTPGTDLLAAAEEFCRDADAQGLLDSSGNPDVRQFAALLRDHASRLFAPVCDLIAEGARDATPADARRYLTEQDFAEYADGMCAVIGDYIRDDGTVDQERLAMENPQLIVPFCVAGVRVGFAADPPVNVPETKLGTLARTFCDRLLKEDLIIAEGPGQFRLKRDSPKYAQLIHDFREELGLE